jgi:hypothetical protein
MDTSETSPDSQQRLARFAFVGVIVSLVAIYLVRNIDRYKELNIEFRYSELVETVEPIRETVENAILSGNFDNITFLDSGKAGLPAEVLASEETHGLSVIDGRIIATWMRDKSDLDNVTYILTPVVEDGDVKWLTTGTCNRKKAC